MWHKSLETYIEGDMMYIDFNTCPPDVVDQGKVSAIGVQGGVTNGVANVLYHKIMRRVKTKKDQNTELHTLTSKYVETINILTFFVSLGLKNQMLIL